MSEQAVVPLACRSEARETEDDTMPGGFGQAGSRTLRRLSSGVSLRRGIYPLTDSAP
jgi:hypothetical protein